MAHLCVAHIQQFHRLDCYFVLSLNLDHARALHSEQHRCHPFAWTFLVHTHCDRTPLTPLCFSHLSGLYRGLACIVWASCTVASDTRCAPWPACLCSILSLGSNCVEHSARFAWLQGKLLLKSILPSTEAQLFWAALIPRSGCVSMFITAQEQASWHLVHQSHGCMDSRGQAACIHGIAHTRAHTHKFNRLAQKQMHTKHRDLARAMTSTGACSLLP